MRKKIVAGNWKMNKSFQEAEALIEDLMGLTDKQGVADTEVILCPPFPYLELATDLLLETDIRVGAQNVSQYEHGAYTGEVSAQMLLSMDVDFCIVGHSERRKYFGEDNKMLAEKVNRLLDNEIIPIFCCGELLPDREAEKHFGVVEHQLSEGLFGLSKDELLNLVIAYEPVWAIGTGVNATPGQAQEMHAFIRNLITLKYGEEVSQEITILYGGSCNAKNAQSLFSNPDVDGGLIGGASLKAEDFFRVVQSA